MAVEALLSLSTIDCSSCVIAARSVTEVVSLRPDRTSSLARSIMTEMFVKLSSTAEAIEVPMVTLLFHTT